MSTQKPKTSISAEMKAAKKFVKDLKKRANEHNGNMNKPGLENKMDENQAQLSKKLEALHECPDTERRKAELYTEVIKLGEAKVSFMEKLGL